MLIKRPESESGSDSSSPRMFLLSKCCHVFPVRLKEWICLSTSLSLSFSRKWRATWLGRMFRSMFSLCSRSSRISFISSFACTRHRKSRRAVYSSWETERIKPVRQQRRKSTTRYFNQHKQAQTQDWTANQCNSPIQLLFYKASKSLTGQRKRQYTLIIW